MQQRSDSITQNSLHMYLLPWRAPHAQESSHDQNEPFHPCRQNPASSLGHADQQSALPVCHQWDGHG